MIFDSLIDIDHINLAYPETLSLIYRSQETMHHQRQLRLLARIP